MIVLNVVDDDPLAGRFGTRLRWQQPTGARARYRREGHWSDRGLADILDEHRASHPDKLAIADDRVRWSYADFADVTGRLAQLLLHLGTKPGARVAAQLPSCGWVPALHFACARIGALFAPLSLAWRRSELHQLLSCLTPRILIAAPADNATDLRPLHHALREQIPSLRELLYVRSDCPASLERALARTEPLSASAYAGVRPDPDGPSLVKATSGSTGLPKGSVSSANDLIAICRGHLQRTLELRDTDIAGGLAPANLGTTGYTLPVLGALLNGASSVMLEKWSPAAGLELIAGEGCTYATAVPTQLVRLLELPLERADLSNFTRFNNAGAPLPPDVARQIEDRMGCRIHTVYGASDGGVVAMTSGSDPRAKRLTTVGKVLAGTELEIRPLGSADGSGVLYWRGPTKSYGYFNQPEYDQQSWTADGWFCCGDIGELDADGYLRIVGRTTEMILRGGTNIYPAEIEDALARHPAVVSAAVVGIGDEVLGERLVAAIVVSGDPPDTAEVAEFLAAAGLARYKRPDTVVVVDALPVNSGGKLDRPALREQLRLRLEAGTRRL